MDLLNWLDFQDYLKRVIEKYKYGESEPSLKRLIALANAGGKSVEWLATGKISPSTHAHSIDTDFIKLPRDYAHSADNRATLPVLGMAACGPNGWAIRENSFLRAVFTKCRF